MSKKDVLELPSPSPRLQLQLRHRGRRVSIPAPGRCSIIQGLNIRLPLLDVHTLESTVVREKAVDLALHVGRLRPDPAAAREKLDLLPELLKENTCTVIESIEVQVDLVGLVDCVDGLLDVPEAG